MKSPDAASIGRIKLLRLLTVVYSEGGFIFN